MPEVIQKLQKDAKMLGKGVHVPTSVELGKIMKQTFPLLKKARKSTEKSNDSEKKPFPDLGYIVD